MGSWCPWVSREAFWCDGCQQPSRLREWFLKPQGLGEGDSGASYLLGEVLGTILASGWGCVPGSPLWPSSAMSQVDVFLGAAGPAPASVPSTPRGLQR